SIQQNTALSVCARHAREGHDADDRDTGNENGLSDHVYCETDSDKSIRLGQVKLVKLSDKFITQTFDISVEEKGKIDTKNVWVTQTLLEPGYKQVKIDNQNLALFLLFDISHIQILLGLKNEQKCKEVLEEVKGRAERNGIIESIR